MTDSLSHAYPMLAEKLRKSSFASLPTPISCHEIKLPGGKRHVTIKHDDLTSPIYGGNKIRKLEYLFQRARDRGAKRIATFGAVGSNHALATAIFAKKFGFGCTCFLAHQKPTPNVPATLNMHLQLGTEIVRYGGAVNRVALFRRYLQNRRTWVIPLGGTCWLGAIGFVNAGLELAAQIRAGQIETPNRIYVASGTMGTAAGLTIGLALANLPIELHAIRVADNQFSHPSFLSRLIEKTVAMLHQLDATVPANLVKRTNVIWRDDFYAGGYAAVDEPTQRAVTIAADQMGLTLETTYTGKAMAALLHDIRVSDGGVKNLFWNTYHSQSLPVSANRPDVDDGLPTEFMRYYL